jgi:outer membrane protein assembly factor BamA
MRFGGVRSLAAVALVALFASTGALAQDPQSRAEELRRERERKSSQLEPYEPGAAEKLLLWLENNRSFERLLSPAEGIYPKMSNITPGSGLSFGAGYRKPGLFGDRAAFSTVGMSSFSGYWLLDARLRFPEIAAGRAFAEVYAQGYDYQSEAFFGIGPRSFRINQSYYGLRNIFGGSRAGVRLGPYVAIGGAAEYMTPVIDPGRKTPTVQQQFEPSTAPGLILQPDFAHYSSFAQINTREPRGNPRKGGLYALRYERYDDLDFSAFSFGRVEAEVQQFVSGFNQRRVLAFRGLVSSSMADDGQQVPFYLQRTLGGPDDLRGFRRNRLRDQHLLLLQAEYRWEVFTAMDAAFFIDWGKVASRRQDLSFDNLERDYGFGVRFGTDNGVFFRVEGAFGSRDGKHLVLSFGDVF